MLSQIVSARVTNDVILDTLICLERRQPWSIDTTDTLFEETGKYDLIAMIHFIQQD
ncbi:MAG: hypothetical protein ACYTGA_02535 [Planctomycetota bacterium]|jgi:hypothetical protein